MPTSTILPGYTQPGFGSYGQVPSVPSPGATATEAIGGNIGNLPYLTSMANYLNQFGQAQIGKTIEQALPGYNAAVGTSMGNIAAHLAGQLPSDVISQLTQRAAERGITTGGGPNDQAALLRALGLTSVGLQSQGESELTGAVSRTPLVKPFDISSMFVTPAQQQEAAYGANVAGAAPNPALAARAAMQAGLAGISAGAGTVPPYQAPTTPLSTWTAPTWTATPWGTPTGAETPASTFDWSSWASGLPGATTSTEPGYYYAGPSAGAISDMPAAGMITTPGGTPGGGELSLQDLQSIGVDTTGMEDLYG